jgi:hypothetical protein
MTTITRNGPHGSTPPVGAACLGAVRLSGPRNTGPQPGAAPFLLLCNDPGTAVTGLSVATRFPLVSALAHFGA